MNNQIITQFQDHTNIRIAEALAYLDSRPEMALPARVEYMRELFDDIYIEIAKGVADPVKRKPFMHYVEQIDKRMVTLH